MRKTQLVIFLLILAVAGFFRLYKLDQFPPGLYPDEAMDGNNAAYALEHHDWKVFYTPNNGTEGLFANLESFSIALFGHTPWALRLVSALIGIGTVAGLWFLVELLFNWQIAAISSFLLATSFWHTVFSRIGFRAIMAPFFLVWALYFFFQGLRNNHWITFAMSGIMWGLGFYTYIAFRVMPLVLLLVLIAYWQALKRDFDHEKYIHARHKLAVGIQVMVIAGIITVLPLAIYFFHNPGDFTGRTSQISVFSSSNPVFTLIKNGFQTLGMFVFTGDHNWRHNFSGDAELFWPIAALFVVGIVREFIKLFKHKKEHGHLSTAPVLLLSWFFVGLAPVVFSNEGLPHALRSIMVAPVAYVFAGLALWWLYETMEKWYHQSDLREIKLTHPYHHKIAVRETALMATLALIVFLGSVGFSEYYKYFHRWGPNPEVAAAFNQNYTDIAKQLLAMPQSKIKYVLVNADGVLVNGIPMPAQSVMFLTDTWTAEKQKAKNIYYLTKDQYKHKQYNHSGVVIPLEQ